MAFKIVANVAILRTIIRLRAFVSIFGGALTIVALSRAKRPMFDRVNRYVSPNGHQENHDYC